jgi:hypothetical protein
MIANRLHRFSAGFAGLCPGCNMSCMAYSQTLLGWTFLILAVAAVVWIMRRPKRMSKRSQTRLHAVLDGDQIPAGPYPYLYVNADGSARELHPNERKYLETPFHPADGARPYIKAGYASKNGWGEITGFLKRSKLPKGTRISAAPEEDPCKPLTRENQIQFLRDKGMETVENSDGSITVRNPNR